MVKGNPEEMPHISDSIYHKVTTLSLSWSMCLSTCTLFPPNKQLYVFHFFLSLYGNSFLQSLLSRALSLATDPLARIQHSHCCGLTSISGWETKILLQATAGGSNPRPIPYFVSYRNANGIL